MRTCKTCGTGISDRPHFSLYCAEHAPPKKEKKPGMRAAINAKCKDCIHDPLDKGTWLQQVRACEARECPLWEWRPK